MLSIIAAHAPASVVRMAAIESRRLLPYPPEQVLAFLSDLHNHWQLEDAFIAVGGVGPDGGRIRILGPLGISREAETTVIAAEPPFHLRGRAELGAGTVGLVGWEIEAADGGSLVRLAATVERAGILDRLLLALGGRRWLSQRFDRVLATLDRRLG